MRAVGVLCLLFTLLHCSSAGSKDKDTPADELKLSAIKSHERNLKPEPPSFQAQALFEQLRIEEEACKHRLGQGALTDGSGACHCYALEYYMENGTCVEYKGKTSAAASAEQQGLEVRLKGMPVCYTANACSKVLQQRSLSISEELSACGRRDEWLGGRVSELNETLQRDLAAREGAAGEVQSWIRDLRAENQRMISELKKYSALSEDNRRLKTDMQRMKAERARLEAKADALRTELQDAKAARDEASAEGENSKCSQTINALKQGLTDASLPIPAL